MKISICMIVKDEEKYLPRCLKSIKHLLDTGLAELILVDTGSSDKTVEIAKEFTDKIYFHPWQGSFSEARNYSISLAKGEYILILDADEELEKEGIKFIINLFNSNEYKRYNTFVVKEKNFQDEKLNAYSVLVREFIFKNDNEFCYKGDIHNQPQSKEPKKNLDVTLLHYGYIMTDDIKEKKFIRTSALLKKELEKDQHNIYYRARLAAAYSMHGDYDEALKHVEIYTKNIMDNDLINKDTLPYLNDACIVYMNNNKYDSMLYLSNRCLDVQDDFIDFVFYKAYSSYKLNYYSKAVEYCEKFLGNIDEFYNNPLINDSRNMFYTLDSKQTIYSIEIECLYELERYDVILKKVNCSDKNTIINLWYPITNSYLKQKRYHDFIEWYIYICEDKNNNLYMALNYIVNKWFNTQEYSIQEEFQREISTNVRVEKLYKYLKEVDNLNEFHKVKEFIAIINLCEINNLDKTTSRFIIEEFINHEELIYLWNNYNDIELLTVKECILFIIKKTIIQKEYNLLSKSKIIYIFERYIDLCKYITDCSILNLLEEKERNFFNKFCAAKNNLKNNNILDAVKLLKDGVVEFNEMAKPIELYLENVMQNNTSSEFDESSIKIKKLLETLIKEENFEKAKEIINEYERTIKNDLEICSMKAVIAIIENRLDNAEEILREGLLLDNDNYDLLYNMAYLQQLKENYFLANYFSEEAKRVINKKNY